MSIFHSLFNSKQVYMDSRAYMTIFTIAMLSQTKPSKLTDVKKKKKKSRKDRGRTEEEKEKPNNNNKDEKRNQMKKKEISFLGKMRRGGSTRESA